MKSKVVKGLALALVALALLGILHYLIVPLPKPQVIFTFQGFQSVKTNTYAMFNFSNTGKSPVWWEWRISKIEAETPKGWITNRPWGFTTVPMVVWPGSNEVVGLRIEDGFPDDMVRWRAYVAYEYYQHHHARLELADRLIRWHLWLVGDKLNWLLHFLPEPTEKYDEAATLMLTNRPPAPTNTAATVQQ